VRNLGWVEIALILVVVLVIFGANRLPQLGRAVGDTLREFKKSVAPQDNEDKGEGDKRA
jgi:sec-independent protein translocase protein TatA